MYTKALICAALWVAVNAQLAPRQTAAPSTTAADSAVTAITDCHLHGSELYCFAGATEYLVNTTPTATTDLPAQYTDCHHHGEEMYCVDSEGEDVEVDAATDESEEGHDHEGESEEDHDHEESEEGDASSENQHCHFHAGVEHCVGGDESGSEPTCQVPKRDYNVGLRVGLLFAILATSALGVFGPIFLQKILPDKLNLIFCVLKQFGTGIIISTAFVHLYTHASLMFNNECLGELEYESTTSAIVIAGLFLSFIVEYAGQRVVLAKTRSAARLSSEERTRTFLSSEVVGVLVMEAGILFHSLLIGLTLVVADDSFFLTLFVVILFHQMFEGIALGTRIATIGSSTIHTHLSPSPSNSSPEDAGKSVTTAAPATEDTALKHAHGTCLSMRKKLALAALFAFITPIGMAIGIGVLDFFNGNDKSTIVAIGTLDALSAGILVWVGVVEMWAADWVGAHGKKPDLAEAAPLTVALAGFGLVAGLVLMSVLGKWA